MSESETDPLTAVSAEAVKRLADLVEKNGLSELRYEAGNVRVTLRTSAYRPATPALAAAVLPAPVAVAVPGGAPEAEGVVDGEESEAGGAGASETQVVVEAPLMGVFYRAAKPEDPPFVEVGDSVEVGQAVGLIEAMKVFSEVLSEVAGVVRAIPFKNGALVQPGDALVVLEPE